MFNLAVAYDRFGQLKEAIDYYERAHDELEVSLTDSENKNERLDKIKTLIRNAIIRMESNNLKKESV